MTPPKKSARHFFEVSGTFLALGWVMGFWLVVTLSGRVAQRGQELAVARQHLSTYQAMAVLKPHVAAAYQAYASAFEHVGPQAFLEELEGCADSSMQLNLKPQAVRGQDGAKQIGVDVELEATQQGVMTFLDRLFALPSLVELERLQVAASASPEYPLKANLLVSKHAL